MYMPYTILPSRLNALASLQGTGETKPWRTSDSDTNTSDGEDIAHIAEAWCWQLPADPWHLSKEFELQVYTYIYGYGISHNAT
jgi:hypothetical protein